MEKRTHKIAEKVFNEKSEELRQAMYTIMCVNYNALFLTAMKTGRFYDALIYNDCKINCAIFSKNEEFAGDTIKGALPSLKTWISSTAILSNIWKAMSNV